MSFIDISNLSKIYTIPGKGKIVALDNVNLKIDQGEFVCLVGPSGAGKSTLIRMLIKEEQPTKNFTNFQGKDITKIKNKEIPYYRRKVGVVFQDYKLLPQKTVYENIAFALEVCEVYPREIREKVIRILEMVGLSNRSENYPHELSGGEQQRVAIARSLVHSPQIVIADEPTGNLDPINSKDIIDLFLRINKAGASVILATHSQEIVNSLQKRVVTVKGGRIVSDLRSGKYRI
ncbi:MAG: ATP-binding cassette domain-containing protein [Patescibacteria group bacterium]|nr:ATP-binding cassette domain-containing protein [Patescibacteria group bacterium]